MQNLGILDNQYIILSIKSEESRRIYYVAKNIQTNTNYIIEIKRNNGGGNANDNFPANEVNILNNPNYLNCPYILHYIRDGNGSLILNGKQPENIPYIVYENASNYSLFEYIRGERLPEKHAKLIFKKILDAINEIHHSNICHGDIKPENILFDENYNPKIFGFYFSHPNNLQLYSGMKSYVSPEILAKKQLNGIKCDIFSLGQLLFNLVNGILGFKSSDDHDIYYKQIKEKKLDQYWNAAPFNGLNLNNSFKKLFVRMVAYKPDERPSADEILNDEWMNEINNLNNEEMDALENEIRQELHNRESAFSAPNAPQ